MKARGPKPFLIVFALIAMLAMPATVVAQQAPFGTQEINEFYLHPSTTQAGAHPDVHLYFRFCDPLPHVVGATNATPIVVTTLEPHGLTDGASVMIRGVRGNIAANTGAATVTARVTGPNTFELQNVLGQPVAGSGDYTGGGWVSPAPLHGCVSTGQKHQDDMQLRRFLLHLPPGFLGNPEAVGECPADRWVVSDNRQAPGQGCPFTTQVGHSNTRTLTIPFSSAAVVNAPTGLYRVPTNGLEPARLGTNVLFGDPPGPVAIAIKLRSSGDYGLDSAVIDLPKNLGGPQAAITEIETVLCGYAPCSVPSDPSRYDFNYDEPVTVQPLPGARPFFVNPTSCHEARSTLEAWSWSQGNLGATSQSTDVVDDPSTLGYDPRVVPSFTPTGCENVPFDAQLGMTPTDTGVGLGTGQQVAIDYCAFGHSADSCVNGKDFADDQIWQSALRNADVTLPSGMTLSPGGGVGLEGCDFDQFGVNATTGKQENDDPPTCPAGSQVGTINVSTPVLPDGTLSGKVFFGCNRQILDPSNPPPCLTTPGRPTPANPWKLFLLIEGAGLRIKLVGDVDVCGPIDGTQPGYCQTEGQIHNVFMDQPEVPFNRLELNLRGGDRSIIANPDDCDSHSGTVSLTGWAGKTKDSSPTVTPTGCQDPKPFAPAIESAGSDPEQAGANTTSHIVITRQDGEDDIKSLKLSLPVGAVGSLSAVPKCSLAGAQAGNCPDGTKVGTVKTTVGTGTSLLTTSGSLYLAEPSVDGDAATLALVVPAVVGPINLGKVVVLNRVSLRSSDTGVDAETTVIPNSLEGVKLHVRKIEISVDRPGFFINPTGCDPRPLTATFTGYSGAQSTSTMNLSAKGCENLDFGPKLRLISGAKGQNAQLQHPPLTAIVTQGPGEANILNSQVILPDLIRPNAAQFNVPGGLCTDAEFAQRACPALSLAGSARVITPVLPFQLSGPVYVVQEIGSVLPKLYVDLKGQGLEVVLRARNSFLHAIQTVNNFDGLPDVPQAYFELKVNGGPNGILNNFYDACGVAKKHLKYDYTFTGQNGKQVKKSDYMLQQGCSVTSSSLTAAISSTKVKVNKKGIGKVRVNCSKACRGKLTVKGKGASAAKKFKVGSKHSTLVKLKFSKKEVSKIRNKKKIKSKASAKVSGKTVKARVTLIPAKH